jgi:hypothetical protein
MSRKNSQNSSESLKKETENKVEDFIVWLENELPRKFKELVAKLEPKEDTLEKREEPGSKVGPSNANGNKTGSILDRIKPRNDVKAKRVKTDEQGDETAVKQEQNEEDGARPERVKKDPKKVRCTFWPGCKNTDCPFVHPIEPVG